MKPVEDGQKKSEGVVKGAVRTMTNWQSWNIWENSLHMLQRKDTGVRNYPANPFFMDTPTSHTYTADNNKEI